jgi:hypothetical protein
VRKTAARIDFQKEIAGYLPIGNGTSGDDPPAFPSRLPAGFRADRNLPLTQKPDAGRPAAAFGEA